MSTLEDLLASLTPQARQELLAQLDAQSRNGAADPAVTSHQARDTIVRRASGEAPLSYAQRGLWFLSQLRPDISVYNLCFLIDCPDGLDLAALEAALSDLTERHEVLRTAIPAPDGEPRQVIAPSPRVRLAEVSLASDDIAGYDKWARSETTAPFDLAGGPLLRATAVRRGERYTLVLVIHHIIFDARSAEILLDELVSLYDARVSGRPPELSDLPVQFADFAAWQHDRVAAHELDADLAYWRTKLDGLEPLALPADRRRGTVSRSAGAARSFHITEQLKASIAAVGRRQEATLFMVLLAGFVAFLYRYTGRDDIAVGTSVTTRDHPETERLIGYFLNTLVLRTKVPGDVTFFELVDLVKNTVLEAFEHKDVPFELLVEDLAPERSAGGSPLVPVRFELSGSSRSPASESGTSRWPMVRGVAGEGTRADLSLGLADAPDGLDGWIEYDLALFGSGAIDRVCDQLCGLLEAVAARPESVVSQLPFMTDDEEYIEPRDDIEAAIASLFAELTGVERVSARDHFFKIGGDSQLALRLQERLTSDLGVEIPIGELLDDPTVEGMAGKFLRQIMRLLGTGEADGE